MTQRELLIQKLIQAKNEMKTAGRIHRRDLQKHIRRMERELRDYDSFRIQAEHAQRRTDSA